MITVEYEYKPVSGKFGTVKTITCSEDEYKKLQHNLAHLPLWFAASDYNDNTFVITDGKEDQDYYVFTEIIDESLYKI